MSRGYVAVLRRGTDEIELGPDDVQSPDLPDEHSVINEWRFETPYDPDLEFYRHGELLLHFQQDDGSRELDYRGPVDEVKSDDQSGTTTLRGRDTTAFLERDGPERTIVADGVAWEEIDRIWEEIGGWSATVVEPEPQLVDEGRVVQQASTTAELEDTFSDATDGSTPHIVEDGELGRSQSCWVVEGEDEGTGGDIVADDAYSGGEAFVPDREFGGVFFDFTPKYDIPPENVVLAVREDEFDDGGADIEYSVGNDSVTFSNTAGKSSMGWFEIGSLEPTINAGESVSVSIELKEDPGGWEYPIDVVAVFDDRFDYNLDNDVHEPGGYLDGPALYPPGDVATEESEIINNIVSADVDIDTNDTSGEQAIGVSFDGDTFLEATNTASASFANEQSPTASIVGRATLGSTDAVRNNQSPRTGFEPQTISEWELRVDANDLAIFEDAEFEGNYYQILQEAHGEAGLIFRTVPAENGFVAESFVRGDLSESVDWTRLSFDRGFDVSGYANKLTVVGEAPDDGSDRPVIVAESQSEIDRVGEEKPDYIEANESSRAALRNIARVELGQRIGVDRLGGTLEIVPRRLKPGYSYTVDAFDGESVVLERQTFQDGRSPSSRLEFEEITDITTAVASLRKESRTGRR